MLPCRGHFFRSSEGSSLQQSLSVVMLGATGAVGSECARILASLPSTDRLTTLGRRPLAAIAGDCVQQHSIDVFAPDSYRSFLPDHGVAICTLGVGQPSKVSREDFVKIDKTSVLDFARGCKEAGVRHFELLGSIGASSGSPSFYLRTKGELEDGLRTLEFERLSLFRPSMILTPTNRYGFSQAMTLRLWPLLKPVLCGKLRRYRGIPVELLGRAIALNALRPGTGVESLHWDEIMALAQRAS